MIVYCYTSINYYLTRPNATIQPTSRGGRQSAHRGLHSRSYQPATTIPRAAQVSLLVPALQGEERSEIFGKICEGVLYSGLTRDGRYLPTSQTAGGGHLDKTCLPPLPYTSAGGEGRDGPLHIYMYPSSSPP
jgi:hypothetical protein